MDPKVKVATDKIAGAKTTAGTWWHELLDSQPVKWAEANWLLILLALIGLIILGVIIYIIIKILIKKRKTNQTAKELKEDLLLRKQLSRMAQGGERGKKAEKDILRVRLAEIRKDFIYGLSLFKKAEKSLYSMPWYLMVGEPGAGKSDLMRRGGFEYPSGIVDMSQGDSGTSTFHWWISNNAVILDVAGKIFFNRWGGQGDNEWIYLLGLIRKNRRRLPINGIIITVPADALLADEEDLTRKKASLMAEELRSTQRYLGLCLPVYLVVSKMDHVVGFRRFFSHLSSERLGQIFGWSNPDDRGDYQPDGIREFFPELADNLEEQRASLMISSHLWKGDPEEGGASRADSVAPLYSFPNAFRSLDKNLGIYLKTVFSASQWGGECMLMFKGVYFTAAKDKGVVYDPEFAKTKDLKLDEGTVKSPPLPERRYFISDLFHQKIFQEGGLAYFDRIAMRGKRRPFIISTCILFILALFFSVLPWWNYSKVRKSVNAQVEYWRPECEALQKGDIFKSPLLEYDKNHRFLLSRFQPVSGKPTQTRTDFIHKMLTGTQTQVLLPFEYRLASLALYGDYEDLLIRMRRNVYQLSFGEFVFVPAAYSSRYKFLSCGESLWTKEATAALATLLRMEDAFSQRKKFRECSDVKAFNLDNLLEFVFSSNYIKFNELRIKGGWDFDMSNPNSKDFALLGAGTDDARGAINVAIDNFCAQWNTGKAYPDLLLHKIITLIEDIEKFKDIENQLLALNKNFKDDPLDSWTFQKGVEVEKEWKKLLEDLLANAKILERSDDILTNEEQQDQLVNTATEEYNKYLNESFDVLSAISNNAFKRTNDQFFNKITNKLRDAQRDVERKSNEKLKRLSDQLNNLVPNVLTKNKGEDLYDYQIRCQIYADINHVAMPLQRINSMSKLKDSFSNNISRVKDTKAELDEASKKISKSQGMQQAIAFGSNILTLIDRINNYIIVKSALENLPNSVYEYRELIADRSRDYETMAAPQLPLTNLDKNFEFAKDFHPEVVKNIFEELTELDEKLNFHYSVRKYFNDDNLNKDYQELEQAGNAYSELYVNYWGEKIRRSADVKNLGSWQDYIKEARRLKSYQVNGALNQLYTLASRALSDIQLKKGSYVEKLRQEKLDYYKNKIGLLTALFNDSCADSLAAWALLDTKPELAYATFLNSPAKEIQVKYLGVYSGDPKSRIAWWSEFIKQGVETLKNEVDETNQVRLRQVSSKLMYFPICDTPNRIDILGPEQIASQCKLLNNCFELENMLNANADAKNAPKTEKTPEKVDKANALMANMKLLKVLDSNIVFKTKAQRDWWRKLVRVMNVLNNEDKPLVWSLALVDGNTQSKPPKYAAENPKLVPAQYVYRYFEVFSQGNRLGSRMQTSLADGKAVDEPEITEFASAEDLDLVFFENANDVKPANVVKFNDIWSGMNLFLRPGVWYDKKLKTYNVPLIFNDPRGFECYYWLGMKFNLPVPPPEDWPNLDNWIDFSPLGRGKLSVAGLNRFFFKQAMKGRLNEQNEKNFSSLMNEMRKACPYRATPVFKLYIPSHRQQIKPPPKLYSHTRKLPGKFTGFKTSTPNAGIVLTRYFEVYVNGEKVGNRMKTVRSDGREFRNTGISIPVFEGDIEFRFYEFVEDTVPKLSFSVNGPYSIFKLLSQNGKMKNSADFTFMAPIFLEKIQKDNYYTWLGFELDYHYSVPPDTKREIFNKE